MVNHIPLTIPDETVAKGPYEDILHETLTAEYAPTSESSTPRRQNRPKQPGVSYMSDGFSKVRGFVLVGENNGVIPQCTLARPSPD